MNPQSEVIHTYSPDMTRPACPKCGSPVEMPPHVFDPTTPWAGTCSSNHQHVFQLENSWEVLENAGMFNESQAFAGSTYQEAVDYRDEMYSPEEIEALHVDITRNGSTEY